MIKKRNNLKEYFKEKGYSEQEIENHYIYKRSLNARNKETRDKLKIEYKTEFEKAKKYFKKVSFSLKGDGLWLTNKYGRVFVDFESLDYYIKMEGK